MKTNTIIQIIIVVAVIYFIIQENKERIVSNSNKVIMKDFEFDNLIIRANNGETVDFRYVVGIDKYLEENYIYDNATGKYIKKST